MSEGRPSASGQPSRRATIHDVATAAGVSIATVSRVLNGSASVDAALADRVRDACAALRYQPNRAARTLAGGRSVIVGLIVTDIQNPFYMDLARGVEDVALEHGYLLVLCNSAEDPGRERQYIDVLAAEHVAGAIVTPIRERKSDLALLVERGIPVVTVDRRVREPALDAVLIDNVGAAHEAVAHLIRNGYRRIGAVVGPEDTTTARQRMEGYRLALSEADIAHDPRIERFGSYSSEGGRRLAGELLDLNPSVEALFAGNNRIMIGALEALNARGLRVPDDVALAGFDEAPGMDPPFISLTSIVQPAYDLGHSAATRLFQRIEHVGPRARQEIILAHRFVVGASSGPRARVPT